MSERQEHPVHGLVGARVERVEFSLLYPGDAEGGYLQIVFEDGRELEVLAEHHFDSATLDVRVDNPAEQPPTKEQESV